MSSQPLMTANLVTPTALSNQIQLQQATADQWAFAIKVLVNGTDATGNPLETPAVIPAPECYGFGSCTGPGGAQGQQYCGCPNPLQPVYQRSQQVSATQWLAALRQYQAPFVSNPVVTQPGGSLPSPGSSGSVGSGVTAPPASTSTNATQSGTQVTATGGCPAGQTCTILGGSTPDLYVYIGGFIVLAGVAFLILKHKKK
jgi:hypothetical protein